MIVDESPEVYLMQQTPQSMGPGGGGAAGGTPCGSRAGTLRSALKKPSGHQGMTMGGHHGHGTQLPSHMAMNAMNMNSMNINVNTLPMGGGCPSSSSTGTDPSCFDPGPLMMGGIGPPINGSATMIGGQQQRPPPPPRISTASGMGYLSNENQPLLMGSSSNVGGYHHHATTLPHHGHHGMSIGGQQPQQQMHHQQSGGTLRRVPSIQEMQV